MLPMHHRCLSHGFILDFFNALQTLIPEIESTSPSSTSFLANRFSVHLDLPSGGLTSNAGQFSLNSCIYLSEALH